MSLTGKTVLITGSARRVGRVMALAVARAGAQVIIHHAHSPTDAASLRQEILALGGQAELLEADLGDAQQAARLVERAWKIHTLDAVVNNAAIFESLHWDTTGLGEWEKHMAINLTAPFLISQAFARHVLPLNEGRIVNILDWRALRPGPDHLPYTISKAGLAALTQALAIALAPKITVNGIAFGAILPPSDGALDPRLLEDYPARRWADLDEVSQVLLFLLDGPTYITGEIIHLDGGRHLT